MSNETKQRPIETLRDGAIKAALWENKSEKGTFYNVTFARTYKDAKGELRDTESFSGTQLLRLAHLAQKAYDRASERSKAAKMTEETAEEAGGEA